MVDFVLGDGRIYMDTIHITSNDHVIKHIAITYMFTVHDASTQLELSLKPYLAIILLLFSPFWARNFDQHLPINTSKGRI